MRIEFSNVHPVRALSKQAENFQAQIQQYLADPSHKFTLKFELNGTKFQKKVWLKLTQIPTGTTISYGELAEELNSSARAVGNACRANPLPIIFPCHRVVAKDDLGGFAGETEGLLLSHKKWLLKHEGAIR